MHFPCFSTTNRHGVPTLLSWLQRPLKRDWEDTDNRRTQVPRFLCSRRARDSLELTFLHRPWSQILRADSAPPCRMTVVDIHRVPTLLPKSGLERCSSCSPSLALDTDRIAPVS